MRPRLKAILGVLFALVLGSATLTTATASGAGTQSQAAAPATAEADTPTPADLEQFRKDLSGTLERLAEEAAAIRRSGVVAPSQQESEADPRGIASQAREDLRTMSTERLEQVYVTFESTFPGWRQAPRALRTISQQASIMSADGAVRPLAITPDNCQDAFNAAPSWTDWGVTVAFAIAAEGAFNIIPPPLNATAMAAWIPLAEGANAAELLNLMFERCSGDQAEKELRSSITSAVTTILGRVDRSTTDIVNNDNRNTTSIIDNDDANTTTITALVNDVRATIIHAVNQNTAQIISNDNRNTTSIIDNDNANTTTITKTVNEARDVIVANDDENARIVSELLLRTQIEADLAESDSATPVAWYLTPDDQGGHLDTVQAIVTETVASVEAAGGDVSGARRFLDRADTQMAAGEFKGAYLSYRRAYKAAAN